MVGGVLARLTHQEAARFSFLLATPVIAGAGVLEVPKLLKAHEAMTTPLSTVIVAGIVAGVVAYLSIVALMHYFKKNEIEALNPFAWYCWCAGTLALICLLRT